MIQCLFKRCFNCNKFLAIEEFYKHPRMFDGHLNYCKSCVRERIEKHRIENLENIRKYDRLRGRTEERKSKNRARSHLYYLHPCKKNYLRQFPDKYKARTILNNSIKKGNIKRKPCEKCGDIKSYAHHPDYNKPLEVIWLCATHHGEAHRKYKE